MWPKEKSSREKREEALQHIQVWISKLGKPHFILNSFTAVTWSGLLEIGNHAQPRVGRMEPDNVR